MARKSRTPEEKVAEVAGLRYITDRRPGLRRIPNGKGFRYVDAKGAAVKDAGTLKRIASLVIPPAWTNVWISPNPDGHLQATGRDDRKRKQYRYHPRWREVRDQNKFDRMIAFGRVLPKLRRRIRRGLREPGLGREKVLAAVVNLLELSALRVGNEEYVNQNKSYGLTTLRHRHARVTRSKIHLHFRGKSGKEHNVDIEHPVLARIVKRCQELPGQDLFAYIDADGGTHDVTSDDVNAYLAEITGGDFTAKDFRTWKGTMLAVRVLREFGPAESKTRLKRNLVRAIEHVAGNLGNTPAVCKKCYIHPAILEGYLEGRSMAVLKSSGAEKRGRSSGLRPEEATVVRLLQEAKRREADPKGLQKDLAKSIKESRPRSKRSVVSRRGF